MGILIECDKCYALSDANTYVGGICPECKMDVSDDTFIEIDEALMEEGIDD